MQEIIRAENIRKTFKLTRKQRQIERSRSGKKVALDGLSFTAYEGEIYGLLGPNGAGKTTMLRILSTLISADAGEAYIAGHSVSREPDKVRSSIGFLTSELKLEDFFTPDYLFGFFGKLHGLSQERIEARKAELFPKFGIDAYAQVKVGDLSTGMKQKASLVISIVHDPAVIIFDEPTNGLDVLTAKVVTDFAGAERAGQEHRALHAYFFARGKAVRPRGRDHRRQDGARGHARCGARRTDDGRRLFRYL